MSMRLQAAALRLSESTLGVRPHKYAIPQLDPPAQSDT
jgi:hypothetical protein